MQSASSLTVCCDPESQQTADAGQPGHGLGVRRACLMQPAYDSSDESDEGGQPAQGDPTGGLEEAHGSFLQGAWQPYTAVSSDDVWIWSCIFVSKPKAAPASGAALHTCWLRGCPLRCSPPCSSAHKNPHKHCTVLAMHAGLLWISRGSQ